MPRWNVKPPIERVRNGYRINLGAEERELVRRLLAELQALLVGSSDNPALKRIFPAAYHLHEHAEHDAEYQRLMREELVASRLSAILTVNEALEARPPLQESQILALMQSLNGLRLVIGTVLDVSEEEDLSEVADDAPNAGEHVLTRSATSLRQRSAIGEDRWRARRGT
jgi:hypothetical protein